MDDLISVIIPVYKVEEYLRRCVDSVLQQSYRNVEIILVDDGSPDACGEICDGYAKQDKRIKVIHQENGGLSYARNVGISAASGHYITFLDSDDWMHRKYVETLHILSRSKDADISVCNFVKTSTEHVPESVEKIETYEFSNVEALRELTGEHNVQMVIACGKLYRIGLFEEIRFPLGKIHEDVFTTYKLLYAANKVIYTTEKLLYYWQRPDSIMGSGFRIKNRLHLIEALQESCDFYESKGEEELKNKTYKTLFWMFKSVMDNIDSFENQQARRTFLESHKTFKSKLRHSKQSSLFRLYYEAYFISPQMISMYAQFKKKLMNIKEAGR